MSSVYERGISIISKQVDKRHDDEISSVLIWFVNLFKRKSAVFGDISNEIVCDIIKNCNFESRKANEIIIRQGDVGDCFYVILRGKVSIYINHKQHDDENEGEVEEGEDGSTSAPDQNLTDFTSSSADFAQNNGNNDEEAELNSKIRDALGNYVTSLDTGEGFGEYALVNDDRRSASIITDETTDLMVVNKALYSRCLQAPALRRFAEKQAFINKSPFFGNWSFKMKKLLSLCLERDIIPRDSFLGKQGEKADRIFFMTKGQAKIVVDPTVHDLQYPTLFPTKSTGIETSNVSTSHREEHTSSHGGRYKESSPIRRRTYTFAEAEKRLKIKHVEIGIIGPGEITGMCEIILNMETYMQSIQCIEGCDVFYIYKRNYERLVRKRNPSCIKKMMEYVYLKIEARNVRLENTKPIQLYEILEHRLEQSINSMDMESQSTRKKSQVTLNNGRTVNRFQLPPAGPIIQMDIRSRDKKKKIKYDKRMAYNGFDQSEVNQSSLHAFQHVIDLNTELDPLNKQSLNDESTTSSDKLSDAIDNKALDDLEERIRQWHYENGCKKPLLEQLHRVDLDKIKTNIKSGGKIILRSTRDQQSTTRLSFANYIDLDSSERSATNTESDEDQNGDYNNYGGDVYNMKSGQTRNNSSKLSRQRIYSTVLSNTATVKPTTKRYSIQYDSRGHIVQRQDEQQLPGDDDEGEHMNPHDNSSRLFKRFSLPVKFKKPATPSPDNSQNNHDIITIHEIKRKTSVSAAASYIDNPYNVPMQCSSYLFRKLSMNQLKAYQYEKNYSKKEYLLLKDELKKQTRRLSISR